MLGFDKIFGSRSAKVGNEKPVVPPEATPDGLGIRKPGDMIDPLNERGQYVVEKEPFNGNETVRNGKPGTSRTPHVTDASWQGGDRKGDADSQNNRGASEPPIAA